jgi:hypothetical protein
MAFPNLPFNVFDDFVMVDWHGCGLSVKSRIYMLEVGISQQNAGLRSPCASRPS